MSRREIKEKTKEMLGKNIFNRIWLYCVLAYVIYTAVLYLPNLIPGIGSVAMLIIGGPALFGLNAIFFKLARGAKDVDLMTLLDGFKTQDVGNIILIDFLTKLFVTLWSFLFIIPGIVKSYAYSLAMYIKQDHPDYDWKKCINESRRMMKGHKMDLFIQDLSFIGWFIVGSICLGVGTFFVMPYYWGARVNFYESINDIPQPVVEGEATEINEEITQ